MSGAGQAGPGLAELEARMRPGGFSQAGFLGLDERLEDVIARDAQTLEKLGLRCEQLADALEAIIDAAACARARAVRVAPHFEVRVERFTGFQICPWAPDPHHAQCQAGGGVRNASVDWHVRNARTGQAMRGPGLIPHLIRAHGFFEGVRSPHRVDPGELARLLELRPQGG